MAEEEKTEGEGEGTEGEEKASGGKKRLILMIVLGVVIIALSVGGTLMAMKLMAPPPPPPAEDEMAEEEAPPPAAPAIYYPIKPAIVVNFQVRGRQRFLQAELTLMTREDDVVAEIETHLPMIRNSLVLLIGGQVYSEIQTAEGKELLRQHCLQELQSLLEKEIGKPGIEQVLFTNFVMQ